MDANVWLMYVAVISVLIAVPGPSALLCLSHGLKFGPSKAVGSILGGLASAFCLMTLSAFGLGALLAASETAFIILKYLGATYLIVLGILMWRDAKSHSLPQSEAPLEVSVTRFALFKKGFMVGISNPKDLLFFAALFPNFMNVDQPQIPQFITLAITWITIEFLIMATYANLGKSVNVLLSNPRILTIFNRITAGIFIVVGGALGVSG